MKLAEYNSIIQYIEKHGSKCTRTVLSDMISTFKNDFPHHTLLSVFLNYLQRKVKATYHVKSKDENAKLYFEIFNQKLRKFEPKNNGSCHALIDVSIEFDMPPCLMARLIVERYLIHKNLEVFKEMKVTEQVSENDQSVAKAMARMDINPRPKNPGRQSCDNTDDRKTVLNPKSTLELGGENAYPNLNDSMKVSSTADSAVQPPQASTKALLSLWTKDPHLIPDDVLREQVLQCMSYDVCYGPMNDAIRHSVGLEFEENLKDRVKNQKLPFLDENDLRKRGYDKTPDVKLEVPIAVRGHPVCWIESKASFGDLETHGEYLRVQYQSYWNRFGPGLVIYWFGFIEEMSEGMLKQGILLMDEFPASEEIAFMNP